MNGNKDFSVEVASGGFVVRWNDPLTESERQRDSMSYPPLPSRAVSGTVVIATKPTLVKWIKNFL